MPYDDVAFTREKLYEEVWSRPVMQLAKEMGVSDVAVAKICRKLVIPVPPRGYWARLAAGQSPKKPALPPATPSMAGSHVFRRWRGPEGAIAPTVTDEDAPVVAVSPTLENPHRLIRTSRGHLERAGREYEGRARPIGHALNVAVSEAALDRALRVMDALLEALEVRGHRVELREVKPPSPAPSHYGARPKEPPAEPEWSTAAVVQDTAVVFSLEEGYETIEVPPPPPSGLRETHSWGLPRPVKERIPNGRLVLAIHNAPRSERLTCGDTKRQAIETRLGTFILLLEATSAAIKAAAVEAARQAEENRRWEEERQKAEERHRREKALVEDAQGRLDLWLAAGRYRQLAEAVEAMSPVDTEDDRRTQWVAWLRSYAARVEREVVRKLPDPEKGPEPSWRY
jgi:hypothetical protein